MTTAIKAIETKYKGYRFRSRLEARWAVFFDTLGVKWEYEKEGFELGAAGRYLPDFWLPKLEMWAEVKEVLQLIGVPTYKVYWAICPPGGGYSWEKPSDLADARMDYILDDQYCHSENRWFGSPALGEDEDLLADPNHFTSEVTRAAYAAARSARFEHGEHP